MASKKIFKGSFAEYVGYKFVFSIIFARLFSPVTTIVHPRFTSFRRREIFIFSLVLRRKKRLECILRLKYGHSIVERFQRRTTSFVFWHGTYLSFFLFSFFLFFEDIFVCKTLLFQSDVQHRTFVSTRLHVYFLAWNKWRQRMSRYITISRWFTIRFENFFDPYGLTFS